MPLRTLFLFILIIPLTAQSILNVSRLSTTSFSPVAGEDFVVADVWGFTDSEGREFAIVTRTEAGISLVDVSDPQRPVMASFLPIPAGASNLFHAKYYRLHLRYCSPRASANY